MPVVRYKPRVGITDRNTLMPANINPPQADQSDLTDVHFLKDIKC